MIKRILVLAMLAVFVVSIQARKDKDEFNYEVVSAGVGTEGVELIKVYSYAKNLEAARLIGKKNAVHAVLFKGIPGSNGTYAKPAMVKMDEKEKSAAFFNDFFKNGTYLNFVTLSTDALVSPKDMLRVGSQYKIGVVFAVNRDALRKYLEDNNVIKAFGSMFN